MKKLTDTLLTLLKVVLRSRPIKRKRPKDSAGDDGKGKTLIVMGNGPSLRQTIEKNRDALAAHDTMAVNFAANTPEYFTIRPRHYILADPLFFTTEEPNVVSLVENLAKTDWPMTLHIPAGSWKKDALKNDNITLQYYNLTPGEGYDALCHTLYDASLALPRPRNVLIPALMEGIREGYEEIYIVGADHTWIHSLYVDDDNRVMSVQPHFYKDDPRELERQARMFAGLRLHNILESMTIAFRSYHAVRKYADRKGVRIYNSTPGSLIDAFTRKPLP